MKFEDFHLHHELVEALRQERIVEPTEVQRQVIPLVQQRRDLIVQSQTGTGKTLAYLLPLLNQLDGERLEVQLVVLAPTRELAKQIYGEVQRYLPALPQGERLRVKLLIGGTDRERQLRQLSTPPQVLVGTPGRVNDLLAAGFSIHTAGSLVIDEADQMVEMGFLEELAQINGQIKQGHQVLCFSATIPQHLEAFLKKMMRQPQVIRIHQQQVAAAVTHHYYLTKQRDRLPILVQLCQLYRPYLGIVFVSKKEDLPSVYSALLAGGIDTNMIHGDMNTRQRKKVLADFRAGKFNILVASDVVARGLDIEGITHVFSYDLPRDLNYYIHRAGRTGRAGEEGTSIVLVAADQEQMLQQLLEKKKIPFTSMRLLRGEIATAPPLASQRSASRRQGRKRTVTRGKQGSKKGSKPLAKGASTRRGQGRQGRTARGHNSQRRKP